MPCGLSHGTLPGTGEPCVRKSLAHSVPVRFQPGTSPPRPNVAILRDGNGVPIGSCDASVHWSEFCSVVGALLLEVVVFGLKAW